MREAAGQGKPRYTWTDYQTWADDRRWEIIGGEAYEVHAVLGRDQALTSPSFPGLQIPLREVFDFPLEPGEAPLVPQEPPAPRYGRPDG